MKKKTMFLLSFLLVLICFGCQKKEEKSSVLSEKTTTTYENLKKFDLSYERDGKIYVISYENNIIDSTLNGYNPALSPDGRYLAYTEYNDNKRIVVLYDLTSKNKIRFNIPNDNHYGPMWSPDGKLIAFNIFINHNWYIAVVNAENTIYKVITERLTKGTFSPTWFSDSKRLTVHDLSNLYIIDLDGNILKNISINEIAKNLSVSSQTRFYFSTDEKKIYFTAEVEDDEADFEEPPEAIFCYDLTLKKLKRISPRGMFCVDLTMKSDTEIVFSGSYRNDEPFSIYKINVNQRNPQLVIKNGLNPTVSLK